MLRFIGIFIFITAIVACSGCRKASDNPQYDVVKIVTPKGEILIKLYDITPRHKASFMKLVAEGYFDSLTFNRVIEDFVAQGGCPDTPEGFANSPYLLEPEFREALSHVYGAVGAGRDNNPEMLSAGCQFYIVQNKDGLHRLDYKYTVFGQVIEGMDVVDTIVKVATDSLDAPLEPITIKLSNIKMDSAQVAQLSR